MIGVQEGKDGALQRHQDGYWLAQNTSNALNESGNLGWSGGRAGASEEGGSRCFRGTPGAGQCFSYGGQFLLGLRTWKFGEAPGNYPVGSYTVYAFTGCEALRIKKSSLLDNSYGYDRKSYIVGIVERACFGGGIPI